MFRFEAFGDSFLYLRRLARRRAARYLLPILSRIDPCIRDRAPRLVCNDQVGDAMLIDEWQSIVPFHLVATATG